MKLGCWRPTYYFKSLHPPLRLPSTRAFHVTAESQGGEDYVTLRCGATSFLHVKHRAQSMLDREPAVASHHHHHRAGADLAFCVKMDKGLFKSGWSGK